MAAKLLSNLPKQGETGGQCVAYAGKTCFGKLFGADIAKDIWTNEKTNVDGDLIYTKSTTMPTPPCCIVWNNSPSGHVGVVESSSGSGTSKRYRFSDSNRSPKDGEKVDIQTGKTEAEIKALIGSSYFCGYVQFN